MAEKSNDYFYVVGIGASAGGLRALELFFKNCPEDSGMAFVIVQHLSPDYKSLMPELLAKYTMMPIAEAKDNVEIQPNSIYLIPGNKNLSIVSKRLTLHKRPATTSMNFSIDIFFDSLAKEKGHLSIGVILSGTGSDGTKGAKSIKEAGGTIFAQNPSTSGFDGMPKSVIAQNLADFVLSPEEIPNEIVQYTINPQFNYLISGTDLSHKMAAMNKLLRVIKEKFDIDFSGYKLQTILRRTAKRLNIKKSPSIEEYIDLLYDNPDEVAAIAQEYLIGVTSFFRDKAVFDYIAEKIIPTIVSDAIEQDVGIKMWVIACSTGEEVYTMGMLLEEYLKVKNLNISFKIYGTDVDERAIYKASKGIYDISDVKGIPLHFLDSYFDKESSHYKVKPLLREKIIFSKHNIIVNPPFNKMNFVSCRNLLIYFDNEYKHQTLSTIKYALNPNGFLLLGNSETTGIFDKSFRTIDAKHRIYQNTGSIFYAASNPKNWKINSKIAGKITGKRNIVSLEDQIFKAFNDKMIKLYQGASVCVDEDLNVIHAIGAFRRYIDMPEYGFSRNLMNILSNNLLIPVQSAIRKLDRENLSFVSKEVHLPTEEKVIQVKIVIEKITFSNLSTSAYVMTMMDLGHRQLISDHDSSEPIYDNEDIIQLKETLKETRENLQLSIEEMETSNEELQATNEELLASNEELQSTNEELQSVNEELHSVNSELQSKNIELLKLNADVENLFKNVRIGTLFLDTDNNITRFTPSIIQHFDFRKNDIGRPISLYTGTVTGKELVKWSEKVKKSGKMKFWEVKSEEGIWFMVEIYPYLNISKEIEGVTINFIKIDHFKRQSDEIRRLYTSLDAMTMSTPAIIALCEVNTFEAVYITGRVQDLLGIDVEEFKEKDLSEIIHYDDLGLFERFKKDIKKLKEGETGTCRARITHPSTKELKTILISSSLYSDGSKGKPDKSINVIQDISSVVDMESVLKSNEERYRLAVTSRKMGLWECYDLEKEQVWWSEEYKELLGYNEKELEKGYEHFISIIHHDNFEHYSDELENSFRTKLPFSCLAQLKHKTNGYRWHEIYGITESDPLMVNQRRLICCISDIHDKVIYEKVIQSKQELLGNIFDNSPIGFIIGNKNGTIQECSNGFARILGIETTDVIGRTYAELVNENHREEYEQAFTQLVNEELPFLKMDIEYHAANSHKVWCHIHISPISMTSEKGVDEIKYCGIITDKTEEKGHEINLLSIYKELQQLSISSSSLLNNQVSLLKEEMDRSDLLDSKAKILIDGLQMELLNVHEHLDAMSHYYSLIKGNNTFSNINLNKFVKKLPLTAPDSSPIKIKHEVLPGIYCIETQMELFFIQALKVICIINGNKAPSQVKLNTKSAVSFWEFSLTWNPKSRKKTLLKSIKEFWDGERDEIKGYQKLVIYLLACRKIINNHSGSISLNFENLDNLSIEFTIATYHSE